MAILWRVVIDFPFDRDHNTPFTTCIDWSSSEASNRELEDDCLVAVVFLRWTANGTRAIRRPGVSALE